MVVGTGPLSASPNPPKQLVYLEYCVVALADFFSFFDWTEWLVMFEILFYWSACPPHLDD
jgi:hypothetical protein